jgi:hypothetical protein
MRNTIIGISGKKMSGKDALCAAIMKQASCRSIRIAFADSLKEEVAHACGVSLEFIAQHKNEFRPILQWWGTDFRREFHSKDYWVCKAFTKVLKAYDDQIPLVIIPDVRFESEAKMIKDIGGNVYRISRPTQIIDEHKSETELDSYKGFADIILNTGTLQDLDKEATAILTKLKIK